MDNYIVRIYRREGSDHRKLVGMVEQVGNRRKRAFRSLEELCAILSRSKRMRGHKTENIKKER